MITDLTPTQTISIGIAIALATLIFLTILLTVAYIEEIRQLLTRVGILIPRVPRTNFRTAPFPEHYVNPYATKPPTNNGQECHGIHPLDDEHQPPPPLCSHYRLR